jgi:hypothetical protein
VEARQPRPQAIPGVVPARVVNHNDRRRTVDPHRNPPRRFPQERQLFRIPRQVITTRYRRLDRGDAWQAGPEFEQFGATVPASTGYRPRGGELGQLFLIAEVLGPGDVGGLDLLERGEARVLLPQSIVNFVIS